jgi:ATP-dependent Clp protease protease subunit
VKKKMAKKIKLNGTVVGDSEAWIYDWFGIPTISPGAVSKSLEDAGDEELEVHINSGGGSVFAGSEIYTMLKEHTANIVVKITGLAASAASFIAMAGDKVMISPSAQIMIHNASTSAWGDKGVMEQGRGMLSSTDEAIANVYAIKTGMKHEELLTMMNKETWLNAQEAQRLGFADEVMFSESEPAVKNSISLGAVLPPEVIDKIRNEILKNQGIEGLDLSKMTVGTISNHVNTPAVQPNHSNENEEGETPMNFAELKEKHPDLVNEIMTQAINTERSRIAALNDMAGAPGAAAFIKDAIANGDTAGDVAMKIVKASAERISQEGDDRQKDAQNSGAAAVVTQQPADQAAKDAEAEDESVQNMINYAQDLINKKGGRG